VIARKSSAAAHVGAYLCFALAFSGAPPAALAAGGATLRLIQSIPLPSVKGRIDHLGYDSRRGKLFIAALGNGTVEVLDVRTGRILRSLAGFVEPQGVLCLPEQNRVVVTDGGSGKCSVLDSESYRVVREVALASDPDNLHYDANARFVWVGYGQGALSAMDLEGKRIGEVPLPGHPESFQLDSSGKRGYVNVPEAGAILVVDLDRRRVAETWRLREARANFPMALDERGERLFVGCRRPPRLSIFDSQSGLQLALIPIDGDPDDIFFDEARGRVYITCGAGFIDVLERAAVGEYRLVTRVITGQGARTSLYVPDRGQLFVAVPRRGNREARVLVFQGGKSR
jgi:DNA-binding beta-propeller fold protein YncE